MSFWTAPTPTVLPRAMAIFSACSVVEVAPDTFTLSPSTSILTFDASRPCLSSSFLSSSAGAALASLPPKIDAPTFLTKLINPMVAAPDVCRGPASLRLQRGASSGAASDCIPERFRPDKGRLQSKAPAAGGCSGLPHVVDDHPDDRRD